jgi:hypothetical protein
VPTSSRSAFSTGSGHPRLVGCAVACVGLRVLRVETDGRGGLFGFLGSAVCCMLCAVCCVMCDVCCVLCDVLCAVSVGYVAGLELRLVAIGCDWLRLCCGVRGFACFKGGDGWERRALRASGLGRVCSGIGVAIGCDCAVGVELLLLSGFRSGGSWSASAGVA